MSEETKDSDEQVPEPTAQEPSGGGDGVEPDQPEDIENDPAHDPDDPGLKGLKGG